MEVLARWLLTYLVHSTLLLGLAAALRLGLRERRLAMQEAVLRAALVGGFVTAGLQIGLALKPIGGEWSVPLSARAGTERAAIRPAEAPMQQPVAPTHGSGLWPALEAGVMAMAWRPLAAAHWTSLLLLAWGAVSSLALARLAIAAWRLRRVLRGRRPLSDSALTALASAMARSLGLERTVRVSTAPGLCVPLACGVLRPEICLPEGVMDYLGPDQLAAVCAHEAAHHARRDPALILAARLVEAIAPLQPLNAWARRRLMHLAECLSDDLAVAVSARPFALARSLVDVAWTLGARPVPLGAVACAVGARSRLAYRVERLMNPVRKLESPSRFLLPIAALAVLGMAVVIPAVSGDNAAPGTVAKKVDSPPARKDAASIPDAAAEEDKLRELSKRVRERARAHEADMRKLQAQIDALAGRFEPSEEELAAVVGALESETASRAAALELAVEDAKRQGSGETAKQMEEAAKRMAELSQELRHGSDDMRDVLKERARALAELSRTDDQMREMKRRSAELRDSVPAADELRRAVEEAAKQARSAMDEAREALEIARQTAEEARAAVQRAQQEFLRTLREHRPAAEPKPQP